MDLSTKFKNMNAELLHKVRHYEQQSSRMQIDSSESNDWQPRVTAIEKEIAELKSVLLGRNSNIQKSGIRVQNPKTNPDDFKRLIRDLKNGKLQPGNLASRFKQTERKCMGRVGHKLMTKNIVLSHKLMTNSFGISNNPTKVKIYDSAGNFVARGYKRFANSDHGPYLEVDPKDIYWENLRLKDPRGNSPFFLDYRTQSNMRVYYQVRTVENQPYPPHSQKDCLNVRQLGGRAGGYADYQPDMCYLDARKIRIQNKEFRIPEQYKPVSMQVDQQPHSSTQRRAAINGFNIRPVRRNNSSNGAGSRLPPGDWRVDQFGNLTKLNNRWEVPRRTALSKIVNPSSTNFNSPNFYGLLAEPNGGPKRVHPERLSNIMY